MTVLKFQRFGTLWIYNGIPVYVDNKCITRSWMAWWWPINWIAVCCFIPCALFRVIKKRNSP